MKAWVKRALVAFLVLIAITAVGLTVAPASWVDWIVAKASSGRVRIAETSGTLWRGSGRIVLADTGALQRSDKAGGVLLPNSLLTGVVIPGRCNWTISPWPLLLGRLQMQLKLENMGQPVVIQGNHLQLTGSAGGFDLPQVRMDQLGSPWNTIQPNGALSVQWNEFRLERGRFIGRGSVTISQVSSALSSVRPLGSYRIDFDSNGQSAQLGMSTIAGPLQLEGQGSWTARSGLSFTAYGTAQAEQAKLQPLLALLGRRDGDRTIIRLGRQQ